MLTPSILLPGLYFVFVEVDRLQISAEPAVAVLSAQQGGRNLVQLPELEFALSLSPHCAESGRRESLSITIADTRTTLRGDELQAATTLDVTMRVSPSQLAPFALREFCVDPVSEGESILLRSALTVQASLRCARVEKQSIVFAVEPLDIRLDCIAPAAGPAPAAD